VSRTLFIAVSPGEIWAALAEDDALEALRVMRTGAPSQVGAVYLGRVVALRPELPAALVDIGLDRPGFLDARDADKRSGIDGLTEGQALIVEVMKDARADKAAGLRVVRATGERGAAIAAAASAAKPPARIDAPEPALIALLASFLKPAPDHILIDDRAGFAEARGFLLQRHPALVARLALHAETPPLFEHGGLAGAIDEVLSRRVGLPSGGAVIIEPTHAATIIDVDSGQAAALATNLEAARVVARQIILRNLAGPIVIDFVGMRKRQDCDKVLAALKSALAADREKPEILGWTRLGHVELVRRRRAAPLAEILYERAPDGALRKTAVTIALEALRAAERETRARAGKAITLAAHPDIVAALSEGEGLAARQMLEARLGQALVLEAQPQRPRESFDIRPR
jgi:ribonuclease G